MSGPFDPGKPLDDVGDLLAVILIAICIVFGIVALAVGVWG